LTGFYRFASSPPLWWDEGWTLAAAKNFLEAGHFGQLNAGVRVPQGPSGHYPTILAAALGFRLFGVGIWQGRLPFVLLTLLAPLALFHYTGRLFNRQAAWGALAAALLLVPHPLIHPLLNGRQVLGDVPAALLLLAGAWITDRSDRSGRILLLPAALVWGLAIAVKYQVQVFGGPGLALAALLLLLNRQPRRAAELALTGLAAYAVFRVVTDGFYAALPPPETPYVATTGLVAAAGIVPDAGIRSRALLMVIVFALPFATGLAAEGLRMVRTLSRKGLAEPLNPAGTLLWTIATTWMTWFLLLSNSGDRYLATPILLAAPFTGRWLRDATAGFDLRTTVRRAADAIRLRALKPENGSALLAAVLLPILVPGTLYVYALAMRADNRDLLETAAYLNEHTPAGGLIETYDSELFTFLEPSYHFPPDQVHVDLLQRSVYGRDTPVDYDPLIHDPDYLVVGPNPSAWGLYDDVIASGAFTLEADFGRFKVYTRSPAP